MSVTISRKGQWYVRFRVGPIEAASGPYEERIDALRASETLEVIQCIEEIELWRGLDPLGGEESREDGSGTDTEDFRIQ
jgi:hypothetical protein